MAERLEAFSGPEIYVDSMVLVGAVDDRSVWHSSGRSLLARAVDGSPPLTLITATLTLDEVAFTLFQSLVARPPYGVSSSRSQYLQTHPAAVREIAASIRKPLLELTTLVTVEPVTAADVTEMLEIGATTGLLPRDAIHLAVMRRRGITAIASDDDAFDGIDGITLYKP